MGFWNTKDTKALVEPFTAFPIPSWPRRAAARTGHPVFTLNFVTDAQHVQANVGCVSSGS
jgi:hypothetical protein